MIDILRCLKCHSTLTDNGAELACSCGKRYPRIDGVVVLNKNSNYYGEVKPEAKEDVFTRIKSGEHWRDVIWDKFRHSYWFLHHIITDETRNDFSTLLPVSRNATVLDLGAGWGTTSCHFAQKVGRVISLDGTLDRTRFIQARIEQDKMDNIRTVCVNILDKPFADDSFDIVLLNGVLEWVGTSLPDLHPREAQLATLKEIRRILKHSGALYVGIENSHGYRYILGGMDDHTALHHIGYHTRDKADEVSYKNRQQRYATYTYDMEGYRELLEEAGFMSASFYYPYPDYKWVQSLFPLDCQEPLTFYYNNLHENQEADTEVERTKSLEIHALKHGHVKHHVASYSIVASAGPVASFVSTLKEFMEKQGEDLLGISCRAQDLTFLQISGKTGKQFAKGRLKHLIFERGQEPLWVAFSNRDFRENEMLRREYALMQSQALQQVEYFRVPKTVLANGVAGHTVLFQRYLPGRTMAHVMAAKRFRMGFEPREIYILVEKNLQTAARILTELRQKTVNFNDGEDRTDTQLERVHDFCRNYDFTDDCVNTMAGYATSFVTLVHGDFVPWNILEALDNAPVAMLDWELSSSSRLSVLDWLRFAWGTVYDMARLETDNHTWEQALEAVFVSGDHPVSKAVDAFFKQGVGCGVGSPDLKALMRFFFANEALLQFEHSLDSKKFIIENTHKRFNNFSK